MMTCDQCRTELAEHALGHLPAETSAAVDEHLAACPVCRHEAAALAIAWSALPMQLAPVEPSADLFDRITNRIDHTSQAWKQPSRHAVDDAATTKRRNQLTKRQRVMSYVLAASIFIGLSASFVGLTLPPDDNAALNARVERVAREYGEMAREEFARLQKKPIRLVEMQGPQAAEAFIVWDLLGQQWHFYATGLSPAPAGQTYKLWATGAQGEYFAGPRFSVDDRGLASTVADFPLLAPTAGPKAIVTLETDAEAQHPSGKPVLEAPL